VVALLGFSVVTTNEPNRVVDFMQHHVNLLFFLAVPLMALACRLVAFNNRFNIAEYLVLCAYTSGLHMLVYALLVVPGWYLLRNHPQAAANLYNAYIPAWPLYFGYACAQFHAPKRWRWFAKGAGVIGLVFFAINAVASALAQAFG
jgi:peptidoglycan/LPS O-acetylase OafA/YrhL